MVIFQATAILKDDSCRSLQAFEIYTLTYFTFFEILKTLFFFVENEVQRYFSINSIKVFEVIY